METKLTRPGPWVASRMTAVIIIIAAILAAVVLAGCASGPMVVNFKTGKVTGSTGAASMDGIVISNNTPYAMNVLKYGPAGLEVILENFPPGGSFTLFNDYLPPDQTVVVIANAFLNGMLVGQVSRSFSFYSYGGHSRLVKCVFKTSDFRMSAPPAGVSERTKSYGSYVPPITKTTAPSLINFRGLGH